MRTTTPGTIHSRRVIALGVLRALAFAFLLVGGWFTLQRLAMGAMSGDVRMAYNVWMGIGDWHRMSNGVVFLGLGIVLAFFARPLARWFTPAPEEGCPRCGFARGDDDPTRCTECGLAGVNPSISRSVGRRSDGDSEG